MTYFNHFVNNGYDDVDYFASLTENDLKGIGIENKLHRTNVSYSIFVILVVFFFCNMNIQPCTTLFPVR